MKKLLILLLLASCTLFDNDHTDKDKEDPTDPPVENTTFLESVAEKSFYDTFTTEKVFYFSSDGKILKQNISQYQYIKSLNDSKGIYARETANTTYYISFENEGKDSKYWISEDFTGTSTEVSPSNPMDDVEMFEVNQMSLRLRNISTGYIRKVTSGKDRWWNLTTKFIEYQSDYKGVYYKIQVAGEYIYIKHDKRGRILFESWTGDPTLELLYENHNPASKDKYPYVILYEHYTGSNPPIIVIRPIIFKDKQQLLDSIHGMPWDQVGIE